MERYKELYTYKGIKLAVIHRFIKEYAGVGKAVIDGYNNGIDGNIKNGLNIIFSKSSGN